MGATDGDTEARGETIISRANLIIVPQVIGCTTEEGARVAETKTNECSFKWQRFTWDGENILGCVVGGICVVRRRKWILCGSLCANVDTLNKLMVLRCIRYERPGVAPSIIKYDAGAGVYDFDLVSGVVGESRETEESTV